MLKFRYIIYSNHTDKGTMYETERARSALQKGPKKRPKKKTFLSNTSIRSGDFRIP